MAGKTEKKQSTCDACSDAVVCKLCVADGIDPDDAQFPGRYAYLNHLNDKHGRCDQCGELLETNP